MYFKKLELIGFKSFFEKTTLNFESGITAVVGPNGCGKSNIFDSIRWVLGEQSAKSLRGSEMQDVIFNGTDSKEPLSMAEVSLTFDNEARFFNVGHPEVCITRRLFRSGESEYLLNKTSVRLKDILDLLLGTGIGAESYSIIAQGKIDLVLSSRPEDRRLVFDEAAGITKYKAQKRETLRKLEETEQNLLRVNDIVTEVKRQIGSLERQANKARKYKETFEELKLKEINLAVLEKKRLLAQKDEVINQLKKLQEEESLLLGGIRQQEAKISNRQSELREIEAGLLATRNELLNLENQITRQTEHISFNQEKISELTLLETRLKEQSAQAEEKLIIDEAKLNALKQEHANIRQSIHERSDKLAAEQVRLDNFASCIRSSLENIAKAKKDILELASKIASAKNEISEFSSQQQVFMARKKRLEIEKAKVCEECVIAEAGLNSVTKEVESLTGIVNGINLDIAGKGSEVEKEASVLNSVNSEIEKLEKERLALESHKEFLGKLKNEYEGISESMNAVVFLDRLPKENTGGLVIKIRGQVNLSDEDKSYFEPANFKITGEAKPIELDTQKIQERLASLGEQIGALRNRASASTARIEQFKAAITGLEQDLRKQEIALANKKSLYESSLTQFKRAKEEEDIIVMELQEVDREVSVLEANLSIANSRLSSLENKHRQAEGAILEEEGKISQNNKLREELLVAITQERAELDALKKSVFSDEATLKILEGTFTRDKDSLLNLQMQMQESVEKKASLGTQNIELENSLGGLRQKIEGQKNSLKEKEDKYRQISEGSGDVVAKIELDRRQLDGLKDKLYELQMLDKDIEYKYSGMKERMLLGYKVDLENEVPDAPGEQDTANFSTEIEKLKERLDSYGAVNLVAIEEYDELKKRYDFLIQQQNDLLSAKESLHQAISKINRTTREMFMETFEKVRVEFRNYFRLLFNGGDAQVFLIDEKDVLESGIEIICRPPGKKLQNVLLLSGGEKSLSAIALIFAIFKVKPSPFCILDEIDAALDEANVDRFATVLQEFARQSQFIVITHNKKTIANADVMYGITMQESGISKIVSVKFAKGALEKDRKSEPAVPEPV